MYFRYEFDVNEKAANKMSRTGYMMNWDCLPDR